MADLNISSFISQKVQEFLTQFDTNNNGKVEVANGEYAAMQKALNGGKAEKLGNVDSVSFGNTSATRASNSINWDEAVSNYNKADLSQRIDIKNNVASYVKDKLNTMSENIDEKVIQAITEPIVVSPDMYKQYMGSIEGGIRNFLNKTKELYAEQYEDIRTSIQSEIKQYDARYATDPKTLGVYYFNTEDTQLIATPLMFDIDFQIDDDFVQDLSKMSEPERDSAINLFQSRIYAKYVDSVLKLLDAAKNITEEIKKNQQTTLDSIDKVTMEGNLTHEYGLENVHLLGPIMADKFNISKADPETYYKFLNEVANCSTQTGLSGAKTDGDDNSTAYDLSGRPVKGQKKGVVIQNGKKHIVK